jgi:hypothetical protein
MLCSFQQQKINVAKAKPTSNPKEIRKNVAKQEKQNYKQTV